MTVTYHRHQRGHADLAALAEEKPLSRIALAGLALALLAGLLILLAGPASRWGWWHFRTGFTLIRWGAYLGILAALVCAAALVRDWRRGWPLAAAGLVVALLAVGIPWSFRRTAAGAPPIHDITTDTQNPPAFVAIAPLRADAPNPAAYEGEAVAAQQRRAYPDLRPLMLTLPPSTAFDEALITAQEMGWEIVAAEKGEGRIEATDQTTWFGFKDDVVVRVMPSAGITRVDVRSVSRVGRGDMGTNARRVRSFLQRLRERRPQAVVEQG
ncbi:MAG TPA: DUF1499 domain-containing protein [Longimicrobiaceae bacterium]|nr:DUF1499 domain-containing protein [Longimicrobiaceae bacterium]